MAEAGEQLAASVAGEQMNPEELRNYKVAWEIAHATNDSMDRQTELQSELDAIDRIKFMPGILTNGVDRLIEDQVLREEKFQRSLEEIAEDALPDQEGYDGTTDIWL